MRGVQTTHSPPVPPEPPPSCPPPQRIQRHQIRPSTSAPGKLQNIERTTATKQKPGPLERAPPASDVPTPGKPVHIPTCYVHCLCPLPMPLTRPHCHTASLPSFHLFLTRPRCHTAPLPSSNLFLTRPRCHTAPLPSSNLFLTRPRRHTAPLPSSNRFLTRPRCHTAPLPFTASTPSGVIPPFEAGDWDGFMNTIEHIAKAEVEAPSASQFCFEYTVDAMAYNDKLDEVARYQARHVMPQNACNYSQHLPGRENIVSDCFSRDFHLSNSQLIAMLTSLHHSLSPDMIQIVTVPDELIARISKLEQLKPNGEGSLTALTPSTLAAGISGWSSSSELNTSETPIWTPSTNLPRYASAVLSCMQQGEVTLGVVDPLTKSTRILAKRPSITWRQHSSRTIEIAQS